MGDLMEGYRVTAWYRANLLSHLEWPDDTGRPYRGIWSDRAVAGDLVEGYILTGRYRATLWRAIE